MNAMLLNLLPTVLGVFSRGVGSISNGAKNNQGATLGGVAAALGLGTNPNFNALLADMLVRVAEYIRVLASTAS